MEHLGAIPIITRQILQESIMRGKMAANDERKREASKRLDLYKGEQLLHVEDALKKQFAHPERIRLQTEFTNIVKPIINQVSVVYKKPAIRQLKNKAGDPLEGSGADAYSDMVTKSRLDAMLKTVNRRATLLNTVGVQAVWNEELDGVRLDIWTPELLNVVQDPKDPTKAAAVIMEQSFQDTVTDSVQENAWGSKNLFITWTPDFHMVFDANARAIPELANEDGENPYGIIPVAWFRDDWPERMFWNEGTDDLINAQIQVNVKITELNNLIKMQSFSVPVIIGDNPKGNVSVDPSNFISIPLSDASQHGTPDFKFVSPDPKIAELIDAIKESITRIAFNWGISPDQFRLSGTPSSGFALRLQNLRLIERRQDDVDLYAVWEQDLFNVMRTVWNTHVQASRKIPEDAVMAINFAELDFSEDPMLEARHWDELIRAGVKNRAQWQMSIDHDIKTVDEAVERIKENREINQRTAGPSAFGVAGEDTGIAAALGVTEESPEDEEEEEPES